MSGISKNIRKNNRGVGRQNHGEWHRRRNNGFIQQSAVLFGD